MRFADVVVIVVLLLCWQCMLYGAVVERVGWSVVLVSICHAWVLSLSHCALTLIVISHYSKAQSPMLYANSCITIHDTGHQSSRLWY